MYDYSYWINQTEKRIYYEAYFDYYKALKAYKDSTTQSFSNQNMEIWEFELFLDGYTYNTDNKFFRCFYTPHMNF